jgi:FlaA1/EpsC-like NDP-sugar epimerase
VPILESHIREAVNNNVRGTRIMAMAADRHGCEVFVLISTDKAVNPANVMGATKRAAEIFCQNFNQRSKTRFITVRFGNVLGSAGSVVPLFTEQIRAGGPVTVTHPRMMRYFMTISEACQLILQASVMGRGGEIFVLDMGQRVSITYLAEQMIRLSGREPEKDIRIVYTGLRAGEKLFEELFHENERVSTTQHEKILLVNHRSLEWGLLEKTYAEIDRGCEQYAVETIMKGILRLVPELQHSTEDLPENVIQFEKRQEA